MGRLPRLNDGLHPGVGGVAHPLNKRFADDLDPKPRPKATPVNHADDHQTLAYVEVDVLELIREATQNDSVGWGRFFCVSEPVITVARLLRLVRRRLCCRHVTV